MSWAAQIGISVAGGALVILITVLVVAAIVKRKGLFGTAPSEGEEVQNGMDLEGLPVTTGASTGSDLRKIDGFNSSGRDPLSAFEVPQSDGDPFEVTSGTENARERRESEGEMVDDDDEDSFVSVKVELDARTSHFWRE
jgi:hypothetical protein